MTGLEGWRREKENGETGLLNRWMKGEAEDAWMKGMLRDGRIDDKAGEHG